MLDRVSEYMGDKISEQMPWGALEESNFVQFVHGTARQSQNGDFFYVWDNPMLVSPVSFEKMTFQVSVDVKTRQIYRV